MDNEQMAPDLREVPPPPGGGSWRFDEASWQWVCVAGPLLEKKSGTVRESQPELDPQTFESED